MLFKIASFSAALLVFSCINLHASCVQLTNVSSLGIKSFAPNRPLVRADVAALAQAVSALDNDALLEFLRVNGSAGKFSDLRNALTGLRFAAEQYLQSGTELPQSTRQILAENASTARDLVTFLCRRQIERDLVAKRPAAILRDVSQKPTTQAPDMSGDKDPFYSGLKDLGVLGVFLALTVLTAKLLQVVVLYLVALQRQRLRCDIPVELESMFQSLSGRAVILGRLGMHVIANRQTTADTSDAYKEGLHCSIKIGDKQYSAQILSFEEGQLGLRFERPLTRQTHKALCAYSETPLRYDYGFLRANLWSKFPRIGTGPTTIEY